MQDISSGMVLELDRMVALLVGPVLGLFAVLLVDHRADHLGEVSRGLVLALWHISVACWFLSVMVLVLIWLCWIGLGQNLVSGFPILRQRSAVSRRPPQTDPWPVLLGLLPAPCGLVLPPVQ